ncbi:hypothetical protein RvY_01994 [Ramazzottius varieornatus]|uniref:Uncharacterized protein n=1 Tax=Ramazzottius varieornatus TaxID=947166 RepID=A0A1D1UM10_RAMVA|nr:hypothetical protein RvY_01994 [Ramazzottius varieornatus]
MHYSTARSNLHVTVVNFDYFFATTDSLATEYAKSFVASTFRRLGGHINSPASDVDPPISSINADLVDHHHNQHVQATRAAQQQNRMAKNANSDDIERQDGEKGGERGERNDEAKGLFVNLPKTDAVDKVKTEQQDDDNANEIPKKVKLDADNLIDAIAATKINIPMRLFHGHDDEEIGMFIKKFETACKLQRIPARDMRIPGGTADQHTTTKQFKQITARVIEAEKKSSQQTRLFREQQMPNDKADPMPHRTAQVVQTRVYTPERQNNGTWYNGNINRNYKGGFSGGFNRNYNYRGAFNGQPSFRGGYRSQSNRGYQGYNDYNQYQNGNNNRSYGGHSNNGGYRGNGNENNYRGGFSGGFNRNNNGFNRSNSSYNGGYNNRNGDTNNQTPRPQ